MCGIGAIINFQKGAARVEQAELGRMLEVLAGRGPDGAGTWVSETGMTGPANRRLATQDARLIANQPLFSHDGRIVTVLNGEIYNHSALRIELEGLGYRFKTRNDTEVLANGFHAWGRRILDRIEGQFACVVHDTRSGESLIARDPHGICPLFYTKRNGQLIFGSTVRTILELGKTPKVVDRQAVYDYFVMNSVGWERSFFQDISYLRPGFFLSIHPGRDVEEGRYYKLTPQMFQPDESLDEEAWVERLREILLRGVSSCMSGDKEVGLYLSGGIDSVSLMAIVRKLFPDRVVKTFSAGFCHAITGEAIGEYGFAREMADHFGAVHQEILVSLDEIVTDIGSFDLPPSSIINSVIMRLARAAREDGVNVTLSGEGADETFFGYDHFMATVAHLNPEEFGWLGDCYRLRGEYAKELDPKSAALEDLFRGGGTDIDLDNHRERLFQAAESLRPVRDYTRHLRDEIRAVGEGIDLDRILIYIDYAQKVPEDLLRRVEGPSMGEGVEVRFPFLRDELIRALYRLPMKTRIGDGTTKYMLRRVMRDLLPVKALNRPKSPFGLPAARRQHFKGAGLDYNKPAFKHLFHIHYDQFSELLMEGAYRREEFFAPGVVEELLARQKDESTCGFFTFDWKMWSFASWYQNWVAN